MTIQKLSQGVVHELPKDMSSALLAHKELVERWEDLTPLARNEWICWTVSPKRAETRAQHVERLTVDLLKGKRRPCCWAGCGHRSDRVVKTYTAGYKKEKK